MSKCQNYLNVYILSFMVSICVRGLCISLPRCSHFTYTWIISPKILYGSSLPLSLSFSPCFHIIISSYKLFRTHTLPQQNYFFDFSRSQAAAAAVYDLTSCHRAVWLDSTRFSFYVENFRIIYTNIRSYLYINNVKVFYYDPVNYLSIYVSCMCLSAYHVLCLGGGGGLVLCVCISII